MSKKKISAIYCPRNYASSCEYYRIATERRSSESKSRLITLAISVVGLLITGLTDIHGQGFFVALIMFLVPNIGASTFYRKENTVDKACYAMINGYSWIWAIVFFLGMANVFVMKDSKLCLSSDGVFNGAILCDVHHIYAAMLFLLTMDAFAWFASMIADNRKTMNKDSGFTETL